MWRFISFSSSDNKTGRRGKRVEARFNTDLLTTELGAVMDVSASGVRVRCDGAVRAAAGDVMPLTLRSPGSQLNVVCRVVRVKKAGLRGAAEVSLAFVHADAELRKAIQHLGRFGFLPKTGQRSGATAAGTTAGAKTAGCSTAGGARRRRPKPPLPDYYATLGVGPDASQEHVRHAYHLLARQQHPDATRDDRSAAAFQAITDAYRVLRDPLKRREYDDARREQASNRAA